MKQFIVFDLLCLFVQNANGAAEGSYVWRNEHASEST